MEFLEKIRKNLANSDILLGGGVLAVLILIVIPLPGAVLDALIIISLLSGMVILLTALSSQGPADFSVFPTLLLVMTIYRLAINVATTRMVLTQGANADSAMIEVFGTFVVGGGTGAGGYVVGFIIFLILTLVQILVITKGATRVSEVAARFALDSLPGRQMAIDADLTGGYIDEREARKRRENLNKESSFYGAMDGASKFVQGDVRLGLVITLINILGGLIVGVSIMGLAFAEALEIYTRFTIGDGLVSQIPALLISTATGIIVSRSVSEDSLPEEINKQVLSNANILYVTGAILVLTGFLPGFPTVALFGIGGGLLYLGSRFDRETKRKEDEEVKKQESQAEDKRPESYLQHLRTEPLELEVGYNLIPLVDPKSGGTLLDQISRLRRTFAINSGLIVPPVRIRDNMNLEPGEYAIRLHGSVIADFKLEPDRLMAIDTGRIHGEIEGATEFQEPTYGLRAFWIHPEQKADAEEKGYDVVDPATVIATHLSSVIQENSAEIMERQQIKSIVDSVREENPVIVDEVLNEKKVPLATIQKVLQHLLRENVSIRNMGRILEGIADNAEVSRGDPLAISEAVRYMIRRQIAADYVDENKVLSAISVDLGLDRKLRDAIIRDEEEGMLLNLKPDQQQALLESISVEAKKALDRQLPVVLICSRAIRPAMYFLLKRSVQAKNLAVLAQEEIPEDVKVEFLGQVGMKKEAATA